MLRVGHALALSIQNNIETPDLHIFLPGRCIDNNCVDELQALYRLESVLYGHPKGQVVHLSHMFPLLHKRSGIEKHGTLTPTDVHR